MIALVDGDIVAYRVAAASEDTDEEICILRCDKQMQDILYLLKAEQYKVFLSGSGNFRKTLYPEYKANRKDKPKPKHLQLLRTYLTEHWNAVLANGCEADDLLGVHQTDNTVICSIDKDLLQIPGTHYNWVRGEFTSIPYIKMTLALLNEIGVKTLFENNTIKVAHHPSSITHHSITVESDWSSASYWYSIIALSEVGTQITLSSYKVNSLQGDCALIEIYKDFGVETIFNNDNSISISKVNFKNQKSLIFNLQSSPDIAQTIAVTCFGLGIGCDLYGLHTLKIKKSGRPEAGL